MTGTKKPLITDSTILSFYFLLLAAVAIFIGYTGIVGNIKKFTELAEKKQSYRELSTELDNKKEVLLNNQKILKDLSINESLLTASLPDDFNYEGFVEDVINTSSGFDFAIEKIEFVDEENNTSVATVTFENLADNSNTTNLINSFTKLPRLSFLESLEFEGKYSKKTIRAEFKIFRLPR